MSRLTLSEFALTLAILLVLAFGASQLLQSWLVTVAEDAHTHMQNVRY